MSQKVCAINWKKICLFLISQKHDGYENSIIYAYMKEWVRLGMLLALLSSPQVFLFIKIAVENVCNEGENFLMLLSHCKYDNENMTTFHKK